MGRVERITSGTFEDRVLRSDVPVLVEFSTPNCPACRAARPMLEQFAEEFEGRMKIVEVDVEEEQELGRFFQIRAVPTLAFFNKGGFVDGVVGAPPAAVLRRRLERLSGTCAPRG